MTTVAAELGGDLIDGRSFDVGLARERARQRRLRTLAAALAVPLLFLWYRIAVGAPFNVLALPDLPDDPFLVLLPVFIMIVIGAIGIVLDSLIRRLERFDEVRWGYVRR